MRPSRSPMEIYHVPTAKLQSKTLKQAKKSVCVRVHVDIVVRKSVNVYCADNKISTTIQRIKKSVSWGLEASLMWPDIYTYNENVKSIYLQ